MRIHYHAQPYATVTIILKSRQVKRSTFIKLPLWINLFTSIKPKCIFKSHSILLKMCFIRAISSGFLIINTSPKFKEGCGNLYGRTNTILCTVRKKMLLTPIQAQGISRIKRDTAHLHDILSLETSSYKRYVKQSFRRTEQGLLFSYILWCGGLGSTLMSLLGH